jgi:hypothetical protein
MQTDAHIAPPQFFQIERAGQGRILTEAAILGLNAARQQPQFPAGLHQRGGDGFLFFSLPIERAQFLFSKAVDGFHQHFLF